MFNSAYSLGGIIHVAALVWVLYEVWAVNKTMTDGRKILWSIGALFFSIITAILYYFIEKKNAI
ncbi:MAG: hypothetical protein HKN68_00705 [Saprospiraceae bacterium]|jgi:hypothetical protein|nr:hypothetical protein [Saprospiraceae bacterium]